MYTKCHVCVCPRSLSGLCPPSASLRPQRVLSGRASVCAATQPSVFYCKSPSVRAQVND